MKKNNLMSKANTRDRTEDSEDTKDRGRSTNAETDGRRKTAPDRPAASPSKSPSQKSSNPKSARPNRKVLANLPDAEIDLHALLVEPIPPDDDAIQRELFIKRQYRGEQLTGRMNALFRWRMGVVLITLKAEKRHGEWESYVLKTFPFSTRSATTYMAIARQATEDEARQHTSFDLMLKLGLAKPSNESPSEAIDKAATELKSIWKSVMQLGKHNGPLMTALRRAKSSEPAFCTVMNTIAEIKHSLDSLLADVKVRQKTAAAWDADHAVAQAEEGVK